MYYCVYKYVLLCVLLAFYFYLNLVTSRRTDLLVGAPMFMKHDSDGRLEELGRVYVYLQTGPLELVPHLPHLTGTQIFSRFGSSITPLGDLNQDGFNGQYQSFDSYCLCSYLYPLVIFLQLILYKRAIFLHSYILFVICCLCLIH